mgnify:CR=1 FL=1
MWTGEFIDAASNRGIDAMRDLIEKASLGTAGRHKVYILDEVHMLSTHSFNALLKTLEEPPEHVKFLLATTDPQKLPVTVLSRCLQFNLKRLTPRLIRDRLEFICKEEDVPAEPAALALIARAALRNEAPPHPDTRVSEDLTRFLGRTVVPPHGRNSDG